MILSYRSFVLASLGLTLACASKETTPQKPTDSDAAMAATGAPAMEPIKPSPEHEWLKRFVGDWNAKLSMTPPGGAAQTSEGTATTRLTGGGLWLVSDFQSSVGGQPFIGHEVSGYDPLTKKYIVNWVDSSSTSFWRGEGTIDTRADKVESTVSGADPTGQAMSMRIVKQWIRDDMFVDHMYMKSPDGMESEGMTITYTRRK